MVCGQAIRAKTERDTPRSCCPQPARRPTYPQIWLRPVPALYARHAGRMIFIRAVAVALAASAALATGAGSAGRSAAGGAPLMPAAGIAGQQGTSRTAGAASAPSMSAERAAPQRRGSLRWRWPIDPPPVIVHRFHVGPQRWSAGHRGVDLATAAGTPIRAPADGRISFTGVIAGRPVISIDHGGLLVSSLEPVTAVVHLGQHVSAGDVVGRLSPVPGHCMPSSCLHWGVRAAGRYVDPLLLVGRHIGPIILLPDRPDYAQPWRP